MAPISQEDYVFVFSTHAYSAHEKLTLTLETVPTNDLLPRPQSVFRFRCLFASVLSVSCCFISPLPPSDLLIPQSQAAKKWIPFLFRGRDRKKYGLLCAPLLFAGGTGTVPIHNRPPLSFGSAAFGNEGLRRRTTMTPVIWAIFKGTRAPKRAEYK